MDSTGQLVFLQILLRKDVKSVYNSLLDLSLVSYVIKEQHVYFTLVKCQLWKCYLRFMSSK